MRSESASGQALVSALAERPINYIHALYRALPAARCARSSVPRRSMRRLNPVEFKAVVNDRIVASSHIPTSTTARVRSAETPNFDVPIYAGSVMSLHDTKCRHSCGLSRSVCTPLFVPLYSLCSIIFRTSMAYMSTRSVRNTPVTSMRRPSAWLCAMLLLLIGV